MVTNSCCFDVLGIAPGASEKEIKKAFRRKAVQVHPDKVPPDRKEEANRAFRELHEAYEEAMERFHNKDAAFGNGDFSSRKKTSWWNRKRNKRATDSDIKKTFNDICEELKRESSMRYNQDILECTRQVRAAWPNKETCWNIAKSSFLTREIIDTLILENPELAAYLKKRQEDKLRDFDAENENELRLRVEKINREWPSCKNELRQWVKWGKSKNMLTFVFDWVKSKNLVFDSEWRETADRVINPEAARHIRLWLAEKNADRDRKYMEQYKAAAEEIVRVYPDKTQIRSILKSYGICDRKEIYNLLPEGIRAALTTISQS